MTERQIEWEARQIDVHRVQLVAAFEDPEDRNVIWRIPRVELERRCNYWFEEKEKDPAFEKVLIDISGGRDQDISWLPDMARLLTEAYEVAKGFEKIPLTRKTAFKFRFENGELWTLTDEEVEEYIELYTGVVEKYRNGFDEDKLPWSEKDLIFKARRFFRLHPDLKLPSSDKQLEEIAESEAGKKYQEELGMATAKVGDWVSINLKTWRGIEGRVYKIIGDKAYILYSTSRFPVKRDHTKTWNLTVEGRYPCDDPFGKGPSIEDIVYHRGLELGKSQNLRTYYFEITGTYGWDDFSKRSRREAIWKIIKAEYEIRDDDLRGYVPSGRELREILLINEGSYDLRYIVEEIFGELPSDEYTWFDVSKEEKVKAILEVEFPED